MTEFVYRKSNCVKCENDFIPRPHSLFLFDPRTPVYCDLCRSEETEKFVEMLSGDIEKSLNTSES